MIKFKVITPQKAENNNKISVARGKSYYLITEEIIEELIDKKQDYCIFNTFKLNTTIVKAIKEHYPELLPELKKVEHYIIVFKKLRLFYTTGYQIIVKFDKYYRTVIVFKGEIEIIKEIIDIREL